MIAIQSIYYSEHEIAMLCQELRSYSLPWNVYGKLISGLYLDRVVDTLYRPPDKIFAIPFATEGFSATHTTEPIDIY